MKPPPFGYLAPRELPAALDALAEHGTDGKVLAGGQSLLPILALRLAHPSVLVDIGAVADLQSLSLNGVTRIGAAVTQRRLERDDALRTAQPLVAAALPLIAHPQIRSRGTLCGSVAHADPAAELPAVMLALEASMHIASTRGTRRVEAKDFFVSYLETALADHELLTHVELPPAQRGWSIKELSRRHGDFALAGAVVSLDLDRAGRIVDPRIALFGVASTPVRVAAAEAAAAGSDGAPGALKDIAALAARDLQPPDDVHATASYRRHVSAVLVERALEEAVGRARTGGAV